MRRKLRRDYAGQDLKLNCVNFPLLKFHHKSTHIQPHKEERYRACCALLNKSDQHDNGISCGS